MNFKINVNKFINWNIIILIDLIMVLYLGKVYDLQFGNDTARLVLSIVLISILLLKIINIDLILKKISIIFFVFLIYSLYILISLIIRRENTLSLVMTTLMFPTIFLVTYLIDKLEVGFNKIIRFQVLYTGILSIMYLYSKFILGHHGALMINSIYYIVLLLPFLYLINNSKTKWIAIFITFSIVFISMKRTALICAICSLLIYYLTGSKKYINLKKIRLKNLFAIFISVLALYSIYIFIANKLDLDILKRFFNNNGDISSGRFEIYMNVIRNFFYGNLQDALFGHGYYGVINLTGGLSAHNDFLEILYDFGIVGLILLLIIIFTLFRYAIMFKRHNYKNFQAFCSSIFIFISMCTTSHLIFIPTYVGFLALFWGLNIVDYKNFIKQEKI